MDQREEIQLEFLDQNPELAKFVDLLAKRLIEASKHQFPGGPLSDD